MPTWTEICEDKGFQDLPFEIETNRAGQIIMSPHQANQSLYQLAIQRELLRLLPHGDPIPELALETDDGVRVVDVGWASAETVEAMRGTPASPVAPEICIEVISHANSEEEMAHKRGLYLARGAVEVWICDQAGALRFYNQGGSIQESDYCPGFPARISIGISGKAR